MVVGVPFWLSVAVFACVTVVYVIEVALSSLLFQLLGFG